MLRIALLLAALLSADVALAQQPEQSSERSVKRLLLLGQAPDNHPPSTHEYLPGMRVVAALLADVPGLETTLIQADEPWSEGPALIEKADGVVLFLSQGGRWALADPRRHEALTRLAQRGGAIAGVHWGVGTKADDDVPAFLQLVGACHGGRDRRYQVVETDVLLATPDHPVARGLEPIRLRDEFYFALKRVESDQLTPLVQAVIDGQPQMVSWAWQRPGGGRSFGFTGLHFHENWRQPMYRRLVAQGILWTLDLPIPDGGLNVDLPADALELAPASAGQ